MDIKFAPTFETATALRDEGYCPIECSFGSKGSVMDALCMDHHGAESWRVGVALRAYTEHFGVLREAFLKGEAKFVVTGAADADATFAIAALVGELPHPSRMESAPAHLKASVGKDITVLATLVNQVDTAPIGVRLEDSEEGKMLLLWNQMASGVQDATAFYSGVDRWRSLMGRPKAALLQAVQAEEAARVALARQAKVLRLSKSVTVVQSEAWGFDVWYADHSPVVVALAPNGNVTIGCPDDQKAKDLFGSKGLLEIFPKLEPSGWGGREAIGGSPRGMKFTWEEAVEVGRLLAGYADREEAPVAPVDPWAEKRHGLAAALAKAEAEYASAHKERRATCGLAVSRAKRAIVGLELGVDPSNFFAKVKELGFESLSLIRQRRLVGAVSQPAYFQGVHIIRSNDGALGVWVEDDAEAIFNWLVAVEKKYMA